MFPLALVVASLHLMVDLHPTLVLDGTKADENANWDARALMTRNLMAAMLAKDW